MLEPSRIEKGNQLGGRVDNDRAAMGLRNTQVPKTEREAVGLF